MRAVHGLTPQALLLAALAAAASSPLAGQPRAPAVAGRLSSGCNAAHLCLQQGRFEVAVEWTLPGGAPGSGQPVPLTDDSGAFWFFAGSNLELMVKVLDGRAVNGHFWVFYGALSDVEYTLTVVDTLTGAQRTYENPAGTMASRADTRAFAAPAAASSPAGVVTGARRALPLTGDTQAGARLELVGSPVLLGTGGALAPQPDGEFLLAYSEGSPYPNVDVYARRFDAAGGSGPAHQVSSAGGLVETLWDLLALPGGGYVAVWDTEEMRIGSSTAGSAPAPVVTDEGAIAARLLDATGAPVGPEVRLSSAVYSWFPRAAVLTTGDLVVAWSTDKGLVARRFDGQLQPLGPEIVVHPRADAGGALAPLPDGGFLAAFAQGNSGLLAQRYDRSDAPLGPPIEVAAQTPIGPLVAADAAGGFVVVWTQPAGEDRRAFARLCAPGGEPQGAAFDIDLAPGAGVDTHISAVTRGADGSFLVALSHWVRGTPGISAKVRLFTRHGVPVGPPLPLGGAFPGSVAPGTVVRDPQGGWLVSWHEFSTPPTITSYAQRLRLQHACDAGAGEEWLCLQGGRFRVEVAWELPGSAGSGRALPLTDDSGAFWFFSPENLELLVKVLDGHAVNGRFWVFFGALSDVAYTVTVTDTVTGEVRTYTNPAGTMASRADTAF
jgi:hypothetical protein